MEIEQDPIEKRLTREEVNGFGNYFEKQVDHCSTTKIERIHSK